MRTYFVSIIYMIVICLKIGMEKEKKLRIISSYIILSYLESICSFKYNAYIFRKYFIDVCNMFEN